MKDFFKYVAATVVGIFAFCVVMGVFGVMSIIGMISSSDATRSVADKSVLVLNLSGILSEQGQDDIIGQVTGTGSDGTGLNDILQAIRKAKDEPKIKGIYIQADGLRTGYASLQEIRNTLADFKKSGKWVVAYADSYSQGDYYVASVADKVWLNPKGMLDWHGLASVMPYLKDLYDKVGIKYQVVKVGTYKSATEIYTEDHMSDANRKQTTAFVQGTWRNMVAAVAKSRKLSPDSLNTWADRLITFEDADNLVRYRMVDELVYADRVKAKIKKMLGIDDDKQITQLSVADMRNVKGGNDGDDQIAVYYASGDIMQDEAPSYMPMNQQIVAKDVCADLEDLMNDDDVKAVVLRINSGGGDAYASEQMWHQIVELKKKKPVVVSMGDYAASGAYYMSCPASWIVAQPNTLTGSIGIFALFPDASTLVTQKLGVKFDEVKTNRNSSFGNMLARPFSAEEQVLLQGYVNRGYALFRKRVADGRRQSVEAVEKIAQGRVWLGADALGIHLVDQLGGLDDAVAKAAQLAKTTSYYTAEYPAPASITDQLLATVQGSNYLDEQLRLTLGSLYEPFMQLRYINRREVLQARIPFAIDVK